MQSDRELAEALNARLRDMVLMLRRVNADQAVTSQQASVLGSLEGGPRRMTELAAEHGVKLPTMTALVNRLERDGLVARGRDASDARVVTAGITREGSVQLHRTRERRIGLLVERFAELSEPERETLSAALPLLGRLFADPDRPPAG
ncbi:MarR family winged helix-turn-helix transcriptional regulator [Actinomadura rupiterrae]|uniref:MarR family winged helix-turn-helix transcriptional regulator n=1 Tax=Actinomadura rupiterrae TaxID=559627 RepID=UPI0020A5296A|nr:MarR family transcriptional regulator [Actinomadura rupiterrae]MCP2336689.1 DNA-binding MarR family transcriptional regulator [Actinomadura rupiterrae]